MQNKEWEKKLEEIGIPKEILLEADVSEFYKCLYNTLNPLQNQPCLSLIKFPWQLQLLTGQPKYYEFHYAQNGLKTFNPVLYAFCSCSLAAFKYLIELTPAFLSDFRSTDEHIIELTTLLVVNGRNTFFLNELIKLFDHADLCLVGIIATDWYEGMIWIHDHYPEGFFTQKNIGKLLDWIYFPHQCAFAHFNLPILTWLIENKQELFKDKSDYNNEVIEDEAIRSETILRLDWLLHNAPSLLSTGTNLLKHLIASPNPKDKFEWFKKNNPHYFPLKDEESFLTLTNCALSENNPTLFHEILSLCELSTLPHFPLIIKKGQLQNSLNALNRVLEDNYFIQSISIQLDYENCTILSNETAYLEVYQKINRNKVLYKVLPLLLSLGDVDSVFFQNGLNRDLILTFCKHLFSLYETKKVVLSGEEPVDGPRLACK